MATQNKFTKENQVKKVEELHWDSQQWKSHLRLMQDEIMFIERLLNSYIFEPNTPNLFERLRDYQSRLGKAKAYRDDVQKIIAQHERNLGGMMECTDTTCDMTYYQKHEKIKAEAVNCMEIFQDLKTEVFNYAGGILKQRKSH